MGRDVYLMRLGLGRSALEPPQDSETFTASRAGEWSSSVHGPDEGTPSLEEQAQFQASPPEGTQLYDARGHPANPWSRQLGRRHREAQNDILSVIGVTERKLSTDAVDHFGQSLTNHETSEEDQAGAIIAHAFDMDYEIYGWWIWSLIDRVLTFPPTKPVAFLSLVKTHFRVLKWKDFFFGGLGCYMVGQLVTRQEWRELAVEYMDRVVMAKVASRKWRSAYDKIRPVLATVFDCITHVAALPFRLHSTLQLLGFAPHGRFGLPVRHSLVPFMGSSLIGWNRSALPALALLLYSPLETLLHDLVFRSVMPVLILSTHTAKRRRSSSRLLASDLQSRASKGLEVVENQFGTIVGRMFGLLGWIDRRPVDTEVQHPPQPGLRRRETWPVERALSPEQQHLATAGPHARALENSEESFDPPVLTRTDTAATLDNLSPGDQNTGGISNATVRVASIDPQTGDINLEIGLPESAWQDSELDVHSDDMDEDVVNTTDTLMNGGPHRAVQKRYHKSHLALEPTLMLANLCTEWIGGLLLLPLKALLLRGLVKHVLHRPGLFGVDSNRAIALPGLLASDSAVFASGFPFSQVVQPIILSGVVNIGLGLSFWLAEYATVRWIGIHGFGWGNL